MKKPIYLETRGQNFPARETERVVADSSTRTHTRCLPLFQPPNSSRASVYLHVALRLNARRDRSLANKSKSARARVCVYAKLCNGCCALLLITCTRMCRQQEKAKCIIACFTLYRVREQGNNSARGRQQRIYKFMCDVSRTAILILFRLASICPRCICILYVFSTFSRGLVFSRYRNAIYNISLHDLTEIADQVSAAI